MLDRSFMDDDLYPLCAKPVDNLHGSGDGVELKDDFTVQHDASSGVLHLLSPDK